MLSTKATRLRANLLGQNQPDTDARLGHRPRPAPSRGCGPPARECLGCAQGRNDQETAVLTSSMTLFSTAALHFWSAYDTGHRFPSSRFATSWKPRVEYR